MNNDLDIFEDENILITGNIGFKGAWLSLWLDKLDAFVYGYSLNPPSNPYMFETLPEKFRKNSFYGDIRDKVRLGAIIDSVRPKFVFHLAAQPIVKRSYKEPQLTYETNFMGTMNLLECLKESKSIESIVIVTTDKVYRNEYPYIYNEFSPLGGCDPYSASKACTEILVETYAQYFEDKHISLATVRSGNCLGGGDWGEDRLIPDCIRAIMSNQKIKIRNPMYIRPWQFVLESLYGYLLVAANFKSGAWNFGPPESDCITVLNLVKKFIQFWGKGDFEIAKDATYESRVLQLNSGKSRDNLNWRTQYNIDKTLVKTIDWYTRYYNNPKDLYESTMKQIGDYEELLE